jgi:hypothetical protein
VDAPLALQVCEHPLAVLDFPAAEPAGVGPVETRRVALETIVALSAERAEESDHHEAHDTPAP